MEGVLLLGHELDLRFKVRSRARRREIITSADRFRSKPLSVLAGHSMTSSVLLNCCFAATLRLDPHCPGRPAVNTTPIP